MSSSLLISKPLPENNPKPPIALYINTDGSIDLEVARTPIENLVFEGGGVRGVAYVGAFNVLDEEKMLSQIKRVAGSSAGSIAAFVCALGYNAREIDAVFATIDFANLEEVKSNSGRVFAFINKGYINEGNIIYDKVKEIIKDRVLEINDLCGYDIIRELNIDLEHITFADLKKINDAYPSFANFKDLYITATKLGKNGETQLEIFSAETTPDMEVALAVKASTAIPLFFKPVEYNGAKYVDGGVLSNYPMYIFDDPKYAPANGIQAQGKYGQNLATVGLTVNDRRETASQLTRKIELQNKFSAKLNKVTRAVTELVIGIKSYAALAKRVDNDKRYLYQDRTISLDNSGVGVTQFNLNIQQRRNIIINSENDTRDWVEENTNKPYLTTYEAKQKLDETLASVIATMDDRELAQFHTRLENNENIILKKESNASEANPIVRGAGLDIYVQAKDLARKELDKREKNKKKFSLKEVDTDELKLQIGVELEKLTRKFQSTNNSTKKEALVKKIKLYQSFIQDPTSVITEAYVPTAKFHHEALILLKKIAPHLLHQKIPFLSPGKKNDAEIVASLILGPKAMEQKSPSSAFTTTKPFTSKIEASTKGTLFGRSIPMLTDTTTVDVIKPLLPDWKGEAIPANKMQDKHISVTNQNLSSEFGIYQYKIATNDDKKDTFVAMLKAFKKIHPEKVLPRITTTTDQRKNWIDACKETGYRDHIDRILRIKSTATQVANDRTLAAKNNKFKVN